jgi:hypothetical protein
MQASEPETAKKPSPSARQRASFGDAGGDLGADASPANALPATSDAPSAHTDKLAFGRATNFIRSTRLAARKLLRQHGGMKAAPAPLWA